jgi:hypothetical protein
MDEQSPVPDWPDRPLSESEAVDLCEDEVFAVHVMDHSEAVRHGLDADPDDVIEVVLEADGEYRMYSYSADPNGEEATWQDYGTQPKGGEGGATMRDTLASYRVVAGEPERESES